LEKAADFCDRPTTIFTFETKFQSMKLLLFSFSFVLFFIACSVRPGAYSSTSVPPPPDYSRFENWAAHPEVKDYADKTPDASLEDLQKTAVADVFFLHPTTFLKKSDAWNASVGDAKLNQKTDETTMLHQASIFNGAGRVFAPRYRQAHFRSFFSEEKTDSEEALKVAYADVKAAFEFYLKNYNNGRPIVIAAHSQGALHGLRLVQEFFDGKPLQNRLVAAYLVGWPVGKGEFQSLPPCLTPEQTGCICSWRSFVHGYLPKSFPRGDTIIVVNPLSWTTGKEPAPKSLNEGTVLKSFDKIYPGIADAEVHDGILWVHKPKFPGSVFFTRKNYHIADFNLFYVSVRKNVQARVEAFMKNQR
jgi:hypothetical protein